MQKPPIVVLKFGHTVLFTNNHITVACNEIYRYLRKGYRVVVAASAMGNETAKLREEGNIVTSNPDPIALAKLLRVGELKSAALLSLSLTEAGINNYMADPTEIELIAEGNPVDAMLVDVNKEKLESLVKQYEVLVIPGFLANTKSGCFVTLGKGGTDLSAVFLANALDAERVILFKDVDGIYESDPNTATIIPNRFAKLDWDTVEQISSQVIQNKALWYAKETGTIIELTSCANNHGTLVGPFEKEIAEPITEHNRLKVALLGFGTVGQGVYDQLNKYPKLFEVVGVLVRDIAKHEYNIDNPKLLINDSSKIGDCDPDLLIELMGGQTLAHDLITDALVNGIDVVTANKSLIANEFESLDEIANNSAAALRYSAAVGGGVPVLETIDRIVTETQIFRIEAIVNGTCNFILDTLVDNDDLDSAIELAQINGFAEADPSSDVNGTDAAEKLSIMIRHAFGVIVPASYISCDSLYCLPDGIVKESIKESKVVKQVVTCQYEDGNLACDVTLRKIDNDHFLAGAHAEENRVYITLDSNDIITLEGKGAGRRPTAEAVVADALEISRLRNSF